MVNYLLFLKVTMGLKPMTSTLEKYYEKFSSQIGG